MKDMTDNAVYPSPRDVLSIHLETGSTGRWKIKCDDDSDVHSLSVFGEKGNRYCVIMMKKSGIKRSTAFEDGIWSLSDGWFNDLKVWFALQWVLDARAEGRVLLCGRETRQIFHSPA